MRERERSREITAGNQLNKKKRGDPITSVELKGKLGEEGKRKLRAFLADRDQLAV